MNLLACHEGDPPLSSTWLHALLRRAHLPQAPISVPPVHSLPELEELEPRIVPTVALSPILTTGPQHATETPVGPTTTAKLEVGPLTRTHEIKDAKYKGADHFVPLYQTEPASKAGLPAISSGAASPTGLTPTQIKAYYGINNITLTGGVVGSGQGQTIAIVDAYDNPDLVSSSAANFSTSDLHKFDTQFGLPEPAGFFTKVNQTGVQGSYPSASTGWAGEEDLDVEWAHALAPLAKIVLIEANSSGFTNMIEGAVNTAQYSRRFRDFHELWRPGPCVGSAGRRGRRCFSGGRQSRHHVPRCQR